MFNKTNPPPFKDEIPLFDESQGTAPTEDILFPAVDEYIPDIPETFEMEEEMEKLIQEQAEMLFAGSNE